MKMQEKAMDQQKKEAYSKMCDENEQKMQDRQDKYKEFFSTYDKNLEQRQIAYDQTLG